MSLLESIGGPGDLRGLTEDQLAQLAGEIRDLLVDTCSRIGGHLGPNLGVVELTLAIHRVFDSPHDRVVFDTGHQAYVHKLLTGRAAQFDGLRQEGGLSGYPSQAESDHDIVENSHASTVAQLRRRAGQGLRHPRRGPAHRRGDRRRRADRRHGLGGAQQHRDRPGLPTGDRGQRQRPLLHPDRRRPDDRAHHAAHQPALRARARRGEEAAQRRPRRRPGGLRRAARDEEGASRTRSRRRASSRTSASSTSARSTATTYRRWSRRSAQAKRFGGPVIVHAITRKGFGYDAAEQHEADQFHSPGPFDVDTGEETPKGRIWTDEFADEMVHIGTRRQDVVAHHRGDDAPGRAATSSRPGSPSARSTSASPSSTPPPRPPAWRWAGCTRSWRSTPRSSTGPSTRC